MPSVPVTYRGMILVSTEYKANDRVLKFLTRDSGLLDIYVKRAGKLNSSNAFISVPYMLCDLTCSDSHGYLYLKSGSIIESNKNIMNDLDLMLTAAHFADVLTDISRQSDNSREAYELSCYAYYHLADKPGKRKLFLAVFNWRVLTILGLTVSYSVTNDTQTEISDSGIYYVSATGGEIYSGKRDGPNVSVLTGKSIRVLNFIASSEIDKIFGLTVPDDMAERLADFTMNSLSFQLEKDYKSRFVL